MLQPQNPLFFGDREILDNLILKSLPGATNVVIVSKKIGHAYQTIKYCQELKKRETTQVKWPDFGNNRAHNNSPPDLMDINHKFKLRERGTTKC